MSVDKLRGTHHINSIQPDDIGLLLAAQSYRPDVTNAIRRIKEFNWKPLQFLVSNIISPGPHPKYGGTYPCLKTKNVQELIAELKPADYADISGISNLEKVQVKYGDLLINLTGAGSIGRVSVYYGLNKPITNQHLARMSIKPSFDEGYVASFLRTWWGERALEQGVAGSTGQINMVNDHVRNIPVIVPDPLVQKYIGDKVRKAEQLKNWANSKIKDLNQAFKKQYRSFDDYSTYGEKNYSLKPKNIFDVLTPGSYPPEIELYFKDNQFVFLRDISEVIFSGNTKQDAEPGDISVNQATSRSCSGLFLKKPFNEVIKPETGDYLKKKDIILTNAAHDKNYIGKDVSVYHSNDDNLPSSKVAVIRLNEGSIPVSYVHSYLMTDAGYKQWQSIVRGISAGIHPIDIGRIRIPTPTKTEGWEQIELTADDIFTTAGEALEHAGLLNNAAKKIVELMIEGKVTDQQIVSAQQALEINDTSLDRDFLASLINNGNDKPLFPDLDQLYELLAQSQAFVEDNQ